jgi:hypothetical protein
MGNNNNCHNCDQHKAAGHGKPAQAAKCRVYQKVRECHGFILLFKLKLYTALHTTLSEVSYMTRRRWHWLGATVMVALAAGLLFYPMPEEIAFSDLMCGSQAFSVIGAIALVICGYDESLARESWGIVLYGLAVIGGTLTVATYLLMLVG